MSKLPTLFCHLSNKLSSPIVINNKNKNKTTTTNKSTKITAITEEKEKEKRKKKQLVPSTYVFKQANECWGSNVCACLCNYYASTDATESWSSKFQGCKAAIHLRVSELIMA